VTEHSPIRVRHLKRALQELTEVDPSWTHIGKNGLHKKLGVHKDRAGRILDILEQVGAVGPVSIDGREILVTEPEVIPYVLQEARYQGLVAP
jgi:hypothetical protein